MLMRGEDRRVLPPPFNPILIDPCLQSATQTGAVFVSECGTSMGMLLLEI
jgi:hypothetical protein